MGDFVRPWESFHHRRPTGSAAVPSPIRSSGTYDKGGEPTFCVKRRFVRSQEPLILLNSYKTSINVESWLGPLVRRSEGTSGAWQGCRRQAVALTGGFRASHSVPPSAESMSVTEPARNLLRRSLCAARRAEFFLYEKMGRRAIDHSGSTSEAGRNKSVQT